MPTEQNEKEKIFELKKAQDKDTQVILDARMDVITDPELSDGARNLFTLLFDLSLDPRLHGGRRGEIAISNTQLRERLSRSARAIYGWTHELVQQRHIWVSKKKRPNTEPMNFFHISALKPYRHQEEEIAGDGLWGNGYRRPGRPMPAGARATPCKKRQLLFDQYGKPIFSVLPENAAQTRTSNGSLPQNLREAPAQNDTCHPQNLREERLQNAGGTRTKQHVPPAKNDTTQRQKPADTKESPDVSKRGLESSYNVQRANRFKKGGENEFLSNVTVVLAKWDREYAEKEMVNSGAWWRIQYRKDPDKSVRILSEIDRMIKEGVPFTLNPGAAAVDLWGRFA